jgi:ubiquinone/menaquinone biosynthesis C-methylase UbiE
MSYTIDERNAERQHLLAECLNPTTREVLARLPTLPDARCLDIGCGQGHTTRLLVDALAPAECIGLDYDEALVAYARSQANPRGATFQQGDATQLAFPDASFDVTFCRFLLIHMSDPVRVIREMLRVTRPGGYVVAYEADFAFELAHPSSPALASINKIWHGLFQNPSLGRKIVHCFREAGATSIQAGACVQLEHDAAVVKRTYRLTAEATGSTAVARGILSAAEAHDMVDGFIQLENDPTSTLIRFPDVWTIAKR